jgi:purine-binding chemotaxis protein CheW
LLDSPEVVSMTAINTLDSATAALTPTGAAVDASGGRGRAMMTFLAPGEMAVPIDQVSEILPDVAAPPTFGPDNLLRRIVVNRGRSIPVVSLERLLGSTPGPTAAGAAVLVINSGGQWVGFAVPRLQSIEYAHWEHALRPGPPGADPVAEVLRQRPLATVGTDAGERTIPVIDLQALADAVVSMGGAGVARAA